MPKACKRCGKCCKHFYFAFSKEEILEKLKDAITRGHDGDIVEFSKYLVMVKHTKRKVKSGQWIASCIFYKGKCTIYKHRPFMCKDFPYGRKGTYDGCGYKGKKRRA